MGLAVWCPGSEVLAVIRDDRFLLEEPDRVDDSGRLRDEVGLGDAEGGGGEAAAVEVHPAGAGEVGEPVEDVCRFAVLDQRAAQRGRVRGVSAVDLQCGGARFGEGAYRPQHEQDVDLHALFRAEEGEGEWGEHFVVAVVPDDDGELFHDRSPRMRTNQFCISDLGPLSGYRRISYTTLNRLSAIRLNLVNPAFDATSRI